MISRRTFSKVLAAGVATASITGLSAAQASAGAASQAATGAKAKAVRNVVLVHGAYADGSSWSEVIGRLQAAGLNVTSVQNPLTSLADDVAATRRRHSSAENRSPPLDSAPGSMISRQPDQRSTIHDHADRS
jgi:hypothetical protein